MISVTFALIKKKGLIVIFVLKSFKLELMKSEYNKVLMSYVCFKYFEPAQNGLVIGENCSWTQSQINIVRQMK